MGMTTVTREWRAARVVGMQDEEMRPGQGDGDEDGQRAG